MLIWLIRSRSACISIHAPREGGDRTPVPRRIGTRRFHSTPPARGATLAWVSPPRNASLISIHAPREGGDVEQAGIFGIMFDISIHAPREGGDNTRWEIPKSLPAISIHAPREGGDAYGQKR